MADPGTPVVGALWCLRKIKLPHGTLAQVQAWLSADPRPGATVLILHARDPEHVMYTPANTQGGRGSTFELTREEFLERFQPIQGQAPTPEQVPPERPPQTPEERRQMMLDGWWR